MPSGELNHFDATTNFIIADFGDGGPVIDWAGQSRDTTAPVVSNVLPLPGSTLTRYQPITLDVADLSPGLVSVVAFVKFAGTSETYTIHNSSTFLLGFTSSSTRSGSSTAGFSYSFLPDSGWLADIEALSIIAIDSHGNATSVSYAWPVTPVVVAPTVSNLTPANGSTISPSTFIEFDVSDVHPGLGFVTVSVKLASSTEMHTVHDWTSFRTGYADDSVRTGNALSGYHYQIRHDDGWPDDIEEMRITAVDSLGNQTTVTYAWPCTASPPAETSGYPLFEVLTGAINGSNLVFSFSEAYRPGTTAIYRNGQLLTNPGGNPWTETSPSAGTVTLASEELPLSGDVIVGWAIAEAASGPEVVFIEGVELTFDDTSSLDLGVEADAVELLVSFESEDLTLTVDDGDSIIVSLEDTASLDLEVDGDGD